MKKHDPLGLSPFASLRALAVGFMLAGGVAAYSGAAGAQPATLPSTGTSAVPTYEAVGLYWQSPGDPAACEVKYRKEGETSWSEGLPLWYDARDSQCRGSLVNLSPNTSYQVEFNLSGQAASRGLAFRTWSNQVPVASTIVVRPGSATLNVAEGGSASTGYVVYEGNGATLDGQNTAQFNVFITASYVVVRGLTLKGAQQDAIRISPNVTNVVIEDNDISGWGRQRSGNWGVDMDSGIRAVCTEPTLTRVTIQRNKIHDPRYSANSWSDGHPAGPQAITFSYCGGNHVIRHNEMYSTNGNYFNDVIGGEDNFSLAGFPNADSDIYGNKLSHAWDDGIEAEGANENVRIWGNYIDRTAIGIATTVTSVGPAYVFRNVWNRAQMLEKTALDSDDRQPLFKSGSDSTLGFGRRYFFHNTMLQATQAGSAYGLGGGYGMGGTGATQLINNTFSKNNIYHLWKPGQSAFYQTGSGNEIANDLYSGTPGDATIVNGINGTPVYAPGHGWQSEAGGQYQLDSSSPGYGGGARIPNFNNEVAAPDVGAHQSGAEAMKFGVAGSPGSSVAATTSTKSAIISPTPGSTLTSSSVTFAWDSGSGVTERYLTVGTTASGSEVYGAYQGAAMSRTVSGLPTNGSIVYVRLFSWINGGWQLNSYSYTAANTSPAAVKSSITSPTPGSTLVSSTVTFDWDAGSGVTERYLTVGTTVNGSEIYGAYQGEALSRTVSDLPTNGSNVYVRLFSWINGGWQLSSYTYTAYTAPPAVKSVITSPVPGSTLTSSTVTFEWDAGSGVTERYLTVGTTAAGSEIYGAYQGVAAMSRTVSGLPANGSTVYVRLFSWINGGWQLSSHAYTAVDSAVAKSNIISPAPGSTLTSSTVTFSWDAGNGVTERYLTIGTVPEGSDIYGAYQGAAMTRTVSGLPVNGATLYVRLFSWIDGNWQWNSYTYTAFQQ